MTRAAALLALALGAACDARPPAIGDPCTTRADCPATPASGCVQTWPGGYCLEVACALGSCPPGARCVRGFSFPDAPFDALCLAVCESTDDCRDGYRCADVGQPERVCVRESP